MSTSGRALICGSIAFDSIMVFDGRFKDHILPDKIHMLNVSFLVPQLRREFGGCAGNIAYNLRLLGDIGYPMATVGRDFAPYQQWMRETNVPPDYVRIVETEHTAQAFITTDQDDNQITAFHPGAMQQPVDEAGAVGIATTGRVHHRLRSSRGNNDLPLRGKNGRAFGTPGHDQRLDMLERVGRPPTRALLHHLPLIVIDGQPGRLADEGPQVIAIEHRQSLAGVENEGNPGGGKAGAMLHHAIAAVG